MTAGIYSRLNGSPVANEAPAAFTEIEFQMSLTGVNCHGRDMEIMGEQKAHLTVMLGGAVGKAVPFVRK